MLDVLTATIMMIWPVRGYQDCPNTEIILCMCLANERRRYNATLSLIGWAHVQGDPYQHGKGSNPLRYFAPSFRNINMILKNW